MKTRPEALCLAPLAACISSLFGLATATPLWASTTHTINSCDDGASAAATPGTLRYEITHAAPTDAVDVTAIPAVCGTSYITLYSGEIPVTQSTLAIYGSGKEAIRTIFGRVFKHSGTGTLSISDLTIESGEYLSSYSNKNADGGCIYSAGSVTLTNTSVIDCLAWLYKPGSGSPQARGGAIFAKANVTLTNSNISGNVADAVYDSLASPEFETIGGGIYAASVTASYSTISGNSASAQEGSLGGGIHHRQPVGDAQHDCAQSRVFGAGKRIQGRRRVRRRFADPDQLDGQQQSRRDHRRHHSIGLGVLLHNYEFHDFRECFIYPDRWNEFELLSRDFEQHDCL